jgi:hypothetical protein
MQDDLAAAERLTYPNTTFCKVDLVAEDLPQSFVVGEGQ